MTATPESRQEAKSDRASSQELALHAVEALLERKAQDITILDLRGISGAVSDFFVLATGASDRQVRALTNAVDEHISEVCNEDPWKDEGRDHLQWVLLDYVDTVVHIFSPARREYYELERLWGDAEIEHVDSDASIEEVSLLNSTVESST